MDVLDEQGIQHMDVLDEREQGIRMCRTNMWKHRNRSTRDRLKQGKKFDKTAQDEIRLANR